MTFDINAAINALMKDLQTADYIHANDMPSIDLYMDQVTTFLEKKLSHTRRYPQDKIMTKTMINNYAKNKLLPPPDKKKYSKDHMIILIFIYYFKNLLTISDVDKLLTPLCEKHFGIKSRTGHLSLEDIYEQIFSLEESCLNDISDSIAKTFNISSQCFENEKDSDRLQCFTFICLLSFDVYVKKMMIERLIDMMPD